ncbi:hypothetical protein ACERII_06925 [Evansella sp. AB-rgal1]
MNNYDSFGLLHSQHSTILGFLFRPIQPSTNVSNKVGLWGQLS